MGDDARCSSAASACEELLGIAACGTKAGGRVLPIDAPLTGHFSGQFLRDTLLSCGVDAADQGARCPVRVRLAGVALGREQFRDRSERVGGAFKVGGGVEIAEQSANCGGDRGCQGDSVGVSVGA